jgi:hypothetical protein
MPRQDSDLVTENKKKEKAEENKWQHYVADLYPCPEGSGLHAIGRLVSIQLFVPSMKHAVSKASGKTHNFT